MQYKDKDIETLISIAKEASETLKEIRDLLKPVSKVDKAEMFKRMSKLSKKVEKKLMSIKDPFNAGHTIIDPITKRKWEVHPQKN